MSGAAIGSPKPTRISLPVFIVIALVFWGAAAFAIPMYVDELSTVSKSTIPAEGKDGPLRGFATFRPEGVNPLPPCIVSWKSGKNYNYRNFHGDNIVTFDNGRTLPIRERQPVEFFQNNAPLRPRKADAFTAKADAYFRNENSSVSSYSFFHCLAESEKVWLEGCVKNGQIVGCGGPRSEVTITPGGPQLRRNYLFIHAVGGIALLLLGAGCIFIGLIERYGYSGPLLDELARRRTGRTPPAVSMGIAPACGLGSVLSLFAWPTLPGPAVTLLGAILMVIALFVAIIRRLRTLGAARGYLDDLTPVPLHSRPEGAHEWAVHVAPDTPTVEGFYSGSRHALVQFDISERHVSQSGGKRVHTSRHVAKGIVPRTLAIVDASGPGVLDTTQCIIEAQKMPDFETSDSSRPSWLADMLAPIPRAPMHENYVIRWSVIEPGDRLLIHGDAVRIRSEMVGASISAGYRGMPEVPLIRAGSGTSALVYVGEKSKLRSGIIAELRGHVAGLVVLGLAVAVATAVGSWIVQRFV